MGFFLMNMKEMFAEKVRNVTFDHPMLKSGILGFIICILVFVVLIADIPGGSLDLQVGEESPVGIKATRTIVNRVRTEQIKEEAGRKAVAEALGMSEYYRISSVAAISAEETVKDVFRRLSRLSQESVDQVSSTSIDAFANGLEAEYGIKIPNAFVQRALELAPDQLKDVEEDTVAVVASIMREKRIDQEQLPEIRKSIPLTVEGMALPEEAVPFASELISGVVSPNLVIDDARVEDRRKVAEREAESAKVYVGEYVVRRDEKITLEQLEMLKDLGLLQGQNRYRILVGIALLVVGLSTVVAIYMYQHDREMLMNHKVIGLIGLVFILVIALVKFGNLFIERTGWHSIGYLVPAAFGTILVTVLVSSRIGIIMAVALSTIVGFVWPEYLNYSILALAGGLIGVFSVSKISQRSDLIRAGLFVGLGNVITATALGLVSQDLMTNVFVSAGIGFANGVLSSVLAIGCLPFLEQMFGMTSSVRLLEISNPNHPLLKQLLLTAPGTYHHSIIVGNLAEAAAETIGANSLVARVASHYHDIGKMKRPYFFAENQFTKENPHDKIAPSLSTLIITSHVKDGVELAKQHRLPEVILDAIQQHHGSTTVSYFFVRAMDENKGDNVDETDFKYPGPRPQTKEAAMVMLADSVEAAVRSLSNPTPGRIEGLVRKIVKDRLAAGEFDECDITFKDLDKAADAFVNVLTGIFHSRIEYPEGFVKDIERRKAE